MTRLISLSLSLLLLASCAGRQQSGSQNETRQYLQHTVNWPGETLGSIASWYTGSSANWQAIANANPGIMVKSIRIGQTIKIPQQLVRRSEPMKAEFLEKTGAFQVRADAAPIKPSELEAVQAVESETSTAVVSAKATGLNDKLWQAVSFMDTAEVKSLLGSGADANFKYNDRAMLAWAAQNGNAEIVQALIDAKAEINAIDGIGHTALIRAVETNQLKVVEALIANKADLNIKTRDGDTAALIAVDNSHAEVLRVLISAGADLNVTDNDGNSAALMAAQNANLEIIAMLAAAKANLNSSNLVYTPLSYALSQSNKELVDALLKAGADPNAKTKSGAAPLIQAMDEPELFNLLLQSKADPNVTNSFGDTALMVAVQNDKLELIEALIKAGANINAKSNNGISVLMYAQNMMKTEIVDLLKKHGATD